MRIWGTPNDEVNLSESEKRELLCEIGRRCWQKGFVEANGGNISCRLDKDRVLTSPTFISKGQMTPDDLVVVDLDGKQLSGSRKNSMPIRASAYSVRKLALSVPGRLPQAVRRSNSMIPKTRKPSAKAW